MNSHSHLLSLLLFVYGLSIILMLMLGSLVWILGHISFGKNYPANKLIVWHGRTFLWMALLPISAMITPWSHLAKEGRELGQQEMNEEQEARMSVQSQRESS